MPGSFKIATIGGIDIDINASWLIVLVLFTISFATGLFPQSLPGLGNGAYILLGAITSILLFASVLVHELAHSLVARARGLPVHTIVLYLFGGVSNLEQEPKSPGDEFLVSIVGPLSSLLIGVLGVAIAQPLFHVNHIVAIVIEYLGVMNLFLGVTNLLPGFPLDGGRVLRAIVWGITGDQRMGTRVAAGAGQIIAYLIIFYGILQVFSGNLFGGIWLGFIGWFLLNAAQSSNAQEAMGTVFRGVKVSQVMSPPLPTMEANRTIQQLVDEMVFPHGLRTVLITRQGQLAGQVTLSAIQRIPRDRWDQTTIGEILVPLDQTSELKPDQNLLDVLPNLSAHAADHLPVVDADGHLIGVLDRDAVVRFLQARRDMERLLPSDHRHAVSN